MVRCYGPATGKGSLLPEYKQPCTIEAFDENGKVAYAYTISDCWITEYKAVPGSDVRSNEIMIEHLKIGVGRWERDPAAGNGIDTDFPEGGQYLQEFISYT